MASLAGLRHRFIGIYPGWWVVGACCFLALFPGAIFSYGFPVFYIPIRDELMLTDTQVSLIFALSRGEAGVGGPIVGWMIDRFDSRPIVLIFGLLAGVGLIFLSGVSGYWVFVLVYVGVVSVGNNSGFGQTFLAVTNRWFVRRRAIGMTLVITCYTAGGAMLIPVLSRGVEAMGWRDVMLYSGIFVAVVVIPFSLLIRRSPESMGIDLAEVGEGVEPSSETSSAQSSGQDFTVREALLTPTYWFILLASAFSHLGYQRDPGPRHTHHGVERDLGAGRGRPDGAAVFRLHSDAAADRVLRAAAAGAGRAGRRDGGGGSITAGIGLGAGDVDHLPVRGRAGHTRGRGGAELGAAGQSLRPTQLRHAERHYLGVLQRGDDANAAVLGVDGGPDWRLHRVSAGVDWAVRRQRGALCHSASPPDQGCAR